MVKDKVWKLPLKSSAHVIGVLFAKEGAPQRPSFLTWEYIRLNWLGEAAIRSRNEHPKGLGKKASRAGRCRWYRNVPCLESFVRNALLPRHCCAHVPFKNSLINVAPFRVRQRSFRAKYVEASLCGLRKLGGWHSPRPGQRQLVWSRYTLGQAQCNSRVPGIFRPHMVCWRQRLIHEECVGSVGPI